MEAEKREHWEETKKIMLDRNGLHLRLYLIFVCFAAAIVFAIGTVQFFSVRSQAREETKNRLLGAARNISSTYGTTGYENTIRSVIYTGQFVVRTMQEDGTILLDTDALSVYLRWPEIDLEMPGTLKELKQSPGYLYLERKDPQGVVWIVYGQLLASWDGKREILFLATDTSAEIRQVRDQLLLLVQIAAAILLAAFFLCWFLVKTYLKPIREITDKAKLLSRGDYSVTFPKESYTELNLLSETLDLAVDQFANYEQMRRDMIANVSHDMRTPLTMIKAYAEMIQTLSGDNPQKRNEHLNVIISQTDKLSEFVSASLNLSRLQSEEVRLDYRVFALDDMVRRTVERFQDIDRGENEFILDLDENSMVRADPDKIMQIIYNLVNNSMKYGGGVIRLYVKRGHHRIRLEISDAGEGIPEDKLHMVWTKYYRVNPYDRDTGSTGVGLSIVKEIADLHGLDYGAESPAGGGALFWFEFPEAN